MNSPFLRPKEAKRLLVLNVAMALFYLVALIVLFPKGNIYLYIALLLGEVFHVWQLIALAHAAWNTKTQHDFDDTFEAPVDIYITVAGEPVSIVQSTVESALKIKYRNFHIYVLNDGLVAQKDNWLDIENMVKGYDTNRVTCITRSRPGGAKAGNINNALKRTKSPFVVILDCDHRPLKDFLKHTMGYFIDPKVGFVQSPQYYVNHTASYVANAAWQQQTIFFGPLCRGKDATNSVFMCGTNMVIRREALDSVGGMAEESITEDILTSLLMHAKGWKSVYVPMILAEGLAPEDLSTYWKQQFRWARGSMEVLVSFNPLFLKGLSWQQRLQYLSSVTFYFSGLIVLIDALLPLCYFYLGLIPISAATLSIALIFVPYIFLTLYILQQLSNYTFSFRAIAFSISSWPIYISALLATIMRRGKGFTITSKERADGSHLRLAALHIIYIAVLVVGIIRSAIIKGISASLITNASWGILYIIMFMPFIRAAIADRHADKLAMTRVPMPTEEVTYD